MFEKYVKILKKRGELPDSMHCTIYAKRALQAGMAENFARLDKYHKEIWKDREYAGWSVAYILTKHFGWSSYLVLSKHSTEFDRCMKGYRKNKSYPVWKQPDIPL